MNALATTLICTGMALAAATVAAADDKKANDAAFTYQRNTTPSNVTLQQCKEHMAMAQKSSAKRDEATMKIDAACADMMKKDASATKK